MKTHAKMVATLAAALICSIATQAQAAEDCWLDIYDKTEFQGAHARIQGPADLPTLRQIDGADWSNRIESLVVGNKARVTVFRQENYREEEQGPTYHGEAIKAWGEKPESYSDQEMSFGPGKKEHHLGELKFHQAINSLILRCQN
ncbi:MAG: peptidase inhibitor family I36 protein [Methylotetracoccus sp.]|jgi:hypothetical protein|nr:peptidase inhibitor family I36 protein [Methylotetracoccus sp.]